MSEARPVFTLYVFMVWRTENLPVFYMFDYTVRSGSRCARKSRYVDLVVSIEVAVEVCYCFNVFSC
jgi:hypothetical protein